MSSPACLPLIHCTLGCQTHSFFLLLFTSFMSLHKCHQAPQGYKGWERILWRECVEVKHHGIFPCHPHLRPKEGAPRETLTEMLHWLGVPRGCLLSYKYLLAWTYWKCMASVAPSSFVASRVEYKEILEDSDMCPHENGGVWDEDRGWEPPLMAAGGEWVAIEGTK